jgi:hypothetical protein
MRVNLRLTPWAIICRLFETSHTRSQSSEVLPRGDRDVASSSTRLPNTIVERDTFYRPVAPANSNRPGTRIAATGSNR